MPYFQEIEEEAKKNLNHIILNAVFFFNKKNYRNVKNIKFSDDKN